MKILKHGILYSGKKYTFDCKECECRFRVKANDAYSINTIHGGKNAVIGWNFTFKCPECNTYTRYTVYKNVEKESLDVHYDGAL